MNEQRDIVLRLLGYYLRTSRVDDVAIPQEELLGIFKSVKTLGIDLHAAMFLYLGKILDIR
ncbi:uncharacterized protein G2W53_037268 [Senna tora]|uniref:Uncharacterized protein n=1 Tax=Senna tora TaxID=362788 RepID=A0A834SX71_9FABA|nr:uncharacterized protein G2W53_037268 [Senna tora]